MGRTSPLKAGLITALPFLLVIIIPTISAAPVQETSLSHDKGCFYMNKHHPSGEKIETNEPCLNCTCIGNTLMCYLRVCPFVKPLGESCVSEKHVGDCCPTFWCPQVYPHPTTEKPDTDPRGCYLDGRYYDEGARIPMDPLKPCEVCYCIRNTSVCTMQICELEIDGCFPQYKPGSCCPSRYNCTEQAATTIPPGFMEPEEYEGCRVNGVMYKDGESVPSTDNCETCYCMKHEVVCAVQECTAPADNCVPGEIEEGQCCPTKYECPPTTGIPDFLTTFASVEEIDRNVSLSKDSTLLPELSTTDLEGEIRPLVTMQDAGVKDLHLSTVPTGLTPEVSTAGKVTEGIDEITTVALDAEVSELVTETPSAENATFVTSDLVSRPREPKITEVPEDLFTSPRVTGKPVFFPKHIPGEGVCRHENKTYQSKEKVPSTDPCRLNCICVNSVVQCELVECDLTPPEFRKNCKIKKLEGECCPKYICDDSDISEEPALTTKEAPQVPDELLDEKKTTLAIQDISTDHKLETSFATGGVTQSLGIDTTTGKTISAEDVSEETKETPQQVPDELLDEMKTTLGTQDISTDHKLDTSLATGGVTQSLGIDTTTGKTISAEDVSRETKETPQQVPDELLDEMKTTLGTQDVSTDQKLETSLATGGVTQPLGIDTTTVKTTFAEDVSGETKETSSSTAAKETTTDSSLVTESVEKKPEDFAKDREPESTTPEVPVVSTGISEEQKSETVTDMKVSVTEKEATGETVAEAEIDERKRTTTPSKEIEITATTKKEITVTPSGEEETTEKAEAEKAEEPSSVTSKELTETSEEAVSLTSISLEKTTPHPDIEQTDKASATPLRDFEITITTAKPESTTLSSAEVITEQTKPDRSTVAGEEITDTTEKTVTLVSVSEEKTTQDIDADKEADTSATPIREMEFTASTVKPVQSTPSDEHKVTEKEEMETSRGGEEFTETPEKAVSLTSVAIEKTTQEAEIEKAVETSGTPLKEFELTTMAVEHVTSTPSDVKDITEKADAEITTISAKDFTEATEKAVSLTSIDVEKTTLEAEIEKAVETSATPIKELVVTVTAGASTSSDAKVITEKAEAETTSVPNKDFTATTEEAVSQTSVGVVKTAQDSKIEKATETSLTTEGTEFASTTVKPASSTLSDVDEVTEMEETEGTRAGVELTNEAEKDVSVTTIGEEKTTEEDEIEKAATPIKESETTTSRVPSSSIPIDEKKITEKAEAEITSIPVKDFTETTTIPLSLTSLDVEKTTLEAEIEKVADISVTPVKELEFTVTTGKPESSTLSDGQKVTKEEETEATGVGLEFTQEPEKAVSLTSVAVEKTTQEAEIEKTGLTSVTPIKGLELTTTGEPVSSTPSDIKEVTDKLEAEITSVPVKDTTETAEKDTSLTSVSIEKTTSEAEIEKEAETSATPIKEFELSSTTSEHISSTPSHAETVTESAEAEHSIASGELTTVAEKTASRTSVRLEKTTQEAEIEKTDDTSVTPVKELESTVTTDKPVSSTPTDVTKLTEKAEVEITTEAPKDFTGATEKTVSVTVDVEKTTQEAEIVKTVETSATPIKEQEAVTTSKAVSLTSSGIEEITEKVEAEPTTTPEEELIEATEESVSVSTTGEAKTAEESTIGEVFKTSATPLKEFEYTSTSEKPLSSTPSGGEEITERVEGGKTTGADELFDEREKSTTASSVAVEQTTTQAEITKVPVTSVTDLKELESTATTVKPVPSSTSVVEELTERAEAEVTTVSVKELSETTEKAVSLTSVDLVKTTQKEDEIEKAGEASKTTIKESMFTTTTSEPYSFTPSGVEETSEKMEKTSLEPSKEFTEATEKAVPFTSLDMEKTTQEAEIEKAGETSATTVKELKTTVTTIQPVSSTPSIVEEITEKAEAEMSTVTTKELSEATEKAISLTPVGVEKTTQKSEVEKAMETTATPVKDLEFTITTSKPLSSTQVDVEEVSEKAESVKTEETSTGPSIELTEATEKAVSLTSVEIDKTTLEAEIEKAGEESTSIKELELAVTTDKPVSSTPSDTEEITEKAEAEETTALGEKFTEETEKDISLTTIGIKKTTQEAEIDKAVETSTTSIKELKATVTTSKPFTSSPTGADEVMKKAETEKTSTPGDATFEADRRTTPATDKFTEHVTTVSSDISTLAEETDADIITDSFRVETGSSFDVLDLKKVTETTSLSEGTKSSVTDEISTTEKPTSKQVTEKESITISDVAISEIDEKKESAVPVSEGLPQITGATGAQDEAEFTSSATTIRATSEKELEAEMTSETPKSSLADETPVTPLAVEKQTVFSTTTSTITMSDTSLKTDFSLTTLPTIKFEDVTESVDEAFEHHTTVLVPETVKTGDEELSTFADKFTPTDHTDRDSKIPIETTEVSKSTPKTFAEETITKSTFESSEVTERLETKGLPVSKVILTDSTTEPITPERLPTEESSTSFDLTQVSERDDTKISAETVKAEDISPSLRTTTLPAVDISSITDAEISKASDLTTSSGGEETEATTATPDIKITDQISTLGADKTDVAIESSTPGIKDVTTDIEFGTKSTEVVKSESSTVTKSREPEAQTSDKPEDKVSTEHILADITMTTEPQMETSSLITDITAPKDAEISEKAVTEASTVESDKKISTEAISSKVPEIEKTEGATEITEFGVTTSTPMKSSVFEGVTSERGTEEAETTIADQVTSATDKSTFELSTESKLTSIAEETTESSLLSDKAASKTATSEKSTPSVTTLLSDLSTLSDETDVVSDETTKLEMTSVEGMKTSESIDIISISDSQKTTDESKETTGSLDVNDFSDQSVKPDIMLTTKETEHPVTPVSSVTGTTESEQQAEVSEKTIVTTSERPINTEFKTTTTSEPSKITSERVSTKMTTTEERDESESTTSKETGKTTTKKVSEEEEREELFTKKPITTEFSGTGTDATFIPSKITLTTSKVDFSEASREDETSFATESTEKIPEKLSSVITTSQETQRTTLSDETLVKETSEPPKEFTDKTATTIETDLISKSLATETPEEKITEQKDLDEKDTKSTSLLTTSATDTSSQTDLFESTTISTTFKPDITTDIQGLTQTTVPSAVSLKVSTSTLSTKSEFMEETVTSLDSETAEEEKFAEITTSTPFELSEKDASTEKVKDSEITTEAAVITSKEAISTVSIKSGLTEDTDIASKQTEAVKPSEISISTTEFTPTSFEAFEKTTHVKTTGAEAEEISHVEDTSTMPVSEVDKETPKAAEFSTSGSTSVPTESTTGIVSTKLFEKELTTLQETEAETTTSGQPEKPEGVTEVPAVKETTLKAEIIGTEVSVTESKTISDISSTVSSSEITTQEGLTMLGETSISKETTPAETDAFSEKQKETTEIEAVTKVTSLEDAAGASTASVELDMEELTTREALEPKIAPSTLETVKTSETTVEQKTSTSKFDSKATTTSETKLFDEKEFSTPKILEAELSTLKPEHTPESDDLPETSSVTTLRTLITESEDLSKTETSIVVEDTIQSNRTFAVDSMVVAHSTTPISESTTEAAEITKEKTSVGTTLRDKFEVSEDLLSITKSITDTPSDLLHMTTQKRLSEPQTFEGSTFTVTTVPAKEASTTEKLEESLEKQTTLRDEIIQTVSTTVPGIPTDKAFSTEISDEIGKVSTVSSAVEFSTEKAETHTESPSEIAQTSVITREPSSIQEAEETTTFRPATEGPEMKTTPSKVTETPLSTEESMLKATTSVTDKELEAEMTTQVEPKASSKLPEGEEDITVKADQETTSQASFEFETTKEPSTPLSIEPSASEQPPLILKDISEKMSTVSEDLVTGKASETIKEITETVPESSSISFKEDAEDHGEFSTERTEEKASPKSALGTTPSVETFETSTLVSLETIKPDFETATPEELEKSSQPEISISVTEFVVSSSEGAISKLTTTTSPVKEEEKDIESEEGEEKPVETSSLLDESLVPSTTEAKITSQPPGPVTDSTSSTATTTPEAVTESSTVLAGKSGVTAFDEIESKPTTSRIFTEAFDEAEVTTTEKSDCFVNETSYGDGEPILTVEPCEKCHCASGEIICFKIVCKVPKRGCVPDAVNEDECCPTTYKCPTEDEATEIVTAVKSSVTEKDLSTPIPISFMFSTVPTSISTAILTSKSAEEEKVAADEELTTSEIPATSTLRTGEITSPILKDHASVESSAGTTASSSGASEGISDVSESHSTFKTIEITTESSRSTTTTITSESIPEVKTEKLESETEVTGKEISKMVTEPTDEGRIEEISTTVETDKLSTEEETTETDLITERRRPPAVADKEEKITTISLTTEEKKFTTPVSTPGTSTVSEFTSTPSADVKVKEVGLEITTVKPSFDIETKSVEPALTGEEEKVTKVSFTTEGEKLEITAPASTIRSSTAGDFTTTSLTDVKSKESGLEVTTEEPLFDVETKSIESASTGEEETTTDVSFATEGKKLEITTLASITSSSTISELTSTSLSDEKAKEVGLEITTEKPFLDVKTIPTETTLSEVEVTALEEGGSTSPKPVVDDERTIPEELKSVTDQITTISKDEPKPIPTKETPETSSSSVSPISDERDAETTSSKLDEITKKQPSDMTTKSDVDKLEGTEPTATDKILSEEERTEIAHDITESTVFTSESGETSSVDIKETEAKSTATTPESKLSSISSESTIESRDSETTLSIKSSTTTIAPAADVTSKFQVTGVIKDTETTEKETSLLVEELSTKETTPTTEIKSTSESTESSAVELMEDKITKTQPTASEGTKIEGGTTPFPESSMPAVSSVSSVFTTEERITDAEEFDISSKKPAIELETKSAVTEKAKDFETTTPAQISADEEVGTVSELTIGVTEKTTFTTEAADVGVTVSKAEAEVKAGTTSESRTSTISPISSLSTSTEIKGEAEELSTEKALSEVTTKSAETDKFTEETAFAEKISTLETGEKTTVTSEAEEGTDTVLSELTTKSGEAEKVPQESAFAEEISTLEPGKKTTAISEESTVSPKSTEIEGEETEITEEAVSKVTTKSDEFGKDTEKTVFTEKISTLEPGKKTTALSEEKDKSFSTVETVKMTTLQAISEKEDDLKVTTVVPEAVTSPTITVTSKFISDSLKTSETKEFDLTTSTEAAEIQKETQKVEEVESTIKTTGTPEAEKFPQSTTLKPEETTKILDVISSTSIPAKLPKLDDSITSTVSIPIEKSMSTEEAETTMSTQEVQDIDTVTEEKRVFEDQATTMHAEDASEESVTVASTEFKFEKITTSVTKAPEVQAETTTSTSSEDLSGIKGRVTDGTKFPSDISSELTTLSQTVATETALNDTTLFSTERPLPSLTSTLETLGVEDLKTTGTPLILTSVKIVTDESLGLSLAEDGAITGGESTITTKNTESSESASDISFQKTDITKAFKAVPETTEKSFFTSTSKPTESKDAGISEKDLIDITDKVKSTDIGSTKPFLETTVSPDKTTLSQDDEVSESLELFTETIQTNQTVTSLSKEGTPIFEDEDTVSPTHLSQTSTTEGVQEGETTLQPKTIVALDQTKTTDEIFKFVSTRFTEVAKETEPTTEGTLSFTTFETPMTPKEALTTKGPAIKALDEEISTHLPFEIKTTPKELEISEKDELSTRTSIEPVPSAGLTEITVDLSTSKEELSSPESQTKASELETLTEMTEEAKDTSKPPVDQTLSPEIVADVKQEDVLSTTHKPLTSVTPAVSDAVAQDETVTEQDLIMSSLVTEQPVPSTEDIEKATEAREPVDISAEDVPTTADIKKEFTTSPTVSDELIEKETNETDLFAKSTSLPEETSKLFEVSHITSETHDAETTTEVEADEHLLTTVEARQPEAEISSQTTASRTLSPKETEPSVTTKSPSFTTPVDFKSETLSTIKVPSMSDETDIEAKIASITPLIKLDLTSTISSLITSTVEELSPSLKDQKSTTSVLEDEIFTKESDIMTTTKPLITEKETEISLSAEATSSPIIQPEVVKETTSSEESKTDDDIEVPSTTQTEITEHELLENITESQAESQTETSPKSVTESVPEVSESFTETPKESSTPEVAEDLSTQKIITLLEEAIDAQTTQESPEPFSPGRPDVTPSDEIPSAKDLESSTQKAAEPPVQKSTELPTKGFKGIETTPLPLMTTLAAAIDNGTTPIDEDFLLDEGACIFEGQIYQSAEQIVRADPCEFCFCFRGDIICLQQSCPPPAPNCHRTMIHGYCCPRYDCPVLVTSRNMTALQRRKGQVQPIIIQRRIEKRAIERTPVEVKGCQINGTFYEFGQTVAKSSGPCLHCLCENGGNMRCDPLKCRPQEPLLMKMNKPFFKTRR